MDIASTALELTGSDMGHRIPYKCPINVPRLQSTGNINVTPVNFIHYSDVYETSFVSFVHVLNDGDA